MDVLYLSIDDEQQFFAELDDIVNSPIHSRDQVDNTVTSFVRFAAQFREQYLQTTHAVCRVAFKLMDSSLYEPNASHIRKLLIRLALLPECASSMLYMILALLFLDGRTHPKTYRAMNKHGMFGKLIETVKQGEDAQLQRMGLELLYEMCRVQKMERRELESIDVEFLVYLFSFVEDMSDEHDIHSYAVLKVILVLNEQYMVASLPSQKDQVSAFDIASPAPSKPGTPLPPLSNKVMEVLSARGSEFKAFGENIIFLLNRERETCLQLLVLKFLYLTFTTPETYEYLYTNDLRVLVDVFIRELYDLPDEAQSLRHTYLRVLYPLLSHTQLRQAPHYKADQLRKLLLCLNGTARSAHFQAVDATTIRLVSRCAKVSWLEMPQEVKVQEKELDELSKKMESLGASLGRKESGSATSVAAVAVVQKPPPGKVTPRKMPPPPPPGRRHRNGQCTPTIAVE
ncbi:pre-rRNA processing [Saitoella coloradoensis]